MSRFVYRALIGIGSSWWRSDCVETPMKSELTRSPPGAHIEAGGTEFSSLNACALILTILSHTGTLQPF